MYFLPYVYSLNNDICIYCASFEKPGDCKYCNELTKSQNPKQLTLEEHLLHIKLMLIEYHLFRNKNKTFAEA